MLETVTTIQAETLGESALAQTVARAILDAWDSCLAVHVTGLPGSDVDRAWYDRLVEHLGTPVPLAEDARVIDRHAQRTGQRWMEVRYDPQLPGAYRHSKNAQPLHTDGSYISTFPSSTLMFCVHSAASGGETLFLPGTTLVSMLRSHDPRLLSRLETTPIPHARSGDRRCELAIDRTAGGDILVSWNYFCIDSTLMPDVQRLADDFYAFLQSPPIWRACVPVLLQPGDVLVWKDRLVLHGRTSFAASDVSERFIWKCAVDVEELRQEHHDASPD